MLGALIIGAQSIPIEQAIPSASQSMVPQARTEYKMERVGEDHVAVSQEEGNGYWRIEHYQEYEYHYDHHGKVLERRPTNYKEHLRYWQATN